MMDEIRDDRPQTDSPDAQRRRRRYARPAVDIYSDEQAITLVADVAGMRKSDLELVIEDDDLVIEGPVPARAHRESALPWGYYRRFRLRSAIQRDDISARLEGGVLRVTLPRQPRQPSQKIEVE